MNETSAPHDLDGKAIARRNWLAGLWAAELLGLIGQTAKDYAHDLAHHHPVEPTDPAKCGVVRKLSRDLTGKAGHSEIVAKLSHFLHIARKESHDQ